VKWKPVATHIGKPWSLPVFPFKGAEWKRQCDTCAHRLTRPPRPGTVTNGEYWCLKHDSWALDARLGVCGVDARSHERK
jgi:hypothetical protein